MNAWIGWSLAVLGVAAGWMGWGWQGVVLAVTVIVFWLLLQFSRSLRALQRAAGAPVGSVANAVMLNSRLQPGMRMVQVLPLTRSLGQKLSDAPERWGWTDGGGDQVQLLFEDGKLRSWTLLRAAEPEPPAL